MPQAHSLPINVPFTMTGITDEFTLPIQEDLWSRLVMLGFGIAIIITIFVATYFWIVGVRGSRRFVRCKITYADDFLFLGADGTFYAGTVCAGGDQQEDVNMQQWNKSSGGQDGGGGKRHSGDGGGGGGDDDDDSLAELLKRLMRQDDRRSPDQKQRDEDRRLNTQCIWIGWFDEDDDMKVQSGLKRRYRRCRENMTRERKPFCHSHYLKTNDDPNFDPGAKENKPKKGGHGSGNSTGVPKSPAAVLGGKTKR